MPDIKPPTQKGDKKDIVFTIAVGDVQCVAVNEFDGMTLFEDKNFHN